MYFPVAEVQVNPLVPFFFAFVISLFCSMSGISGAFLLLPWQISVLGYNSPGVSATNQVFNILACPAGVWRYAREKRMLWPLALFIAAGTLPGVFIGSLARLTILSGARYFLFFVSLVLFYLGWRLLGMRDKGKKPGGGICAVHNFSHRGFSFTYAKNDYRVPAKPILALSAVVGLVGGIYGVGGGAIISPVLVSFFGLPVHAIAGACLFATFLTSVAGVCFFSILASLMQMPQAAPDWLLGLTLGAGGMSGMYLGASLQKYFSGRSIRIILALTIFAIGVGYVIKAISSPI